MRVTFDTPPPPPALAAAEVEGVSGFNRFSVRQRVQNTTDTLLKLTGRNMTDFLVKTYEDSGKTR